jgi:hypothetical protein
VKQWRQTTHFACVPAWQRSEPSSEHLRDLLVKLAGRGEEEMLSASSAIPFSQLLASHPYLVFLLERYGDMVCDQKEAALTID